MSASEGVCEGDGEEAESGRCKKPPGGGGLYTDSSPRFPSPASSSSSACYSAPSLSDDEGESDDDIEASAGRRKKKRAGGSCRTFARKRLHEGCFFLKALLATLGGVIFWVGSWNLLDVYILPASVWSELGCVAVGAIVLFATRTFNQHAGLLVLSPPASEYEDLDAEYDSGLKRFFAFLWQRKTRVYLRSFLALWGSVILWKGVYNLFDIYVYQDTFARTMAYVFVGLFLLTVTDTLSSNVGLSPVSIATIVAPPAPPPSLLPTLAAASQDGDRLLTMPSTTTTTTTPTSPRQTKKQHKKLPLRGQNFNSHNTNNNEDLRARRETEEDSPVGSYQS